MPDKRKFKDFETAIERLEEITSLLESGDQPLENSIDLYSEGLEIAKECHRKLDNADKKIKIITENTGIPTEEDFDSEGVTG